MSGRRVLCALGWTLAISVPGASAQSLFGPEPVAPALCFDEDEGGALWAHGRTYNASFDARGATFYPFLGSSAPRNHPLALRLEAVRVGELELAFDPHAPPRRAARLVEYARGSLTERYVVTPDGIEQAFRFEELPSAGDLVLRVAVETELLAAASDAGGLRFHGALGGADYGRATAFDARGRSAPVSSRRHEGAIELRVEATFPAGAALPLLVDPFVSAVTTDDSPTDDPDRRRGDRDAFSTPRAQREREPSGRARRIGTRTV